ncbi:MAG TPA: 1-(5-phosphoribosyl)-5-[(5-phosphoribosylamino)methylideneamino] imidazole-4-carboxamide isomerase [Candidatus Limnocylindrales bacterium]|nr:1-(5-phosphoribosyl)-5-[(5-phosphoribosylamino)methylideneamino] imidazole-4-carboxamide isomerase [Candidatus Limnocylindrales bacterium]
MATPFEILPAIDLRGGRVVRLQQGDPARATVYPPDPLAAAAAFVEAGARWLHVVDLDGALTGRPKHRRQIEAIVTTVGEQAHVEVAGGLRDDASVGAVLALGASRAVVGTAALSDPVFAGRLVDRHGADRIAIAIDVRDGRAVGQGWIAGAAGIEATAAIERLVDVGVRTFEVTAIDRDGLLDGPDLRLYARLVSLGRASIIASGGIASIDDLRAVRDAGCAGAIVGRALYEGRFELREAIDLVAPGG